MDDFYIMQKKVDKSVLCQGMTIPQVFHEVFYQKIGFQLGHGESAKVKASLNGTEYEVKVSNLGFISKLLSDKGFPVGYNLRKAGIK